MSEIFLEVLFDEWNPGKGRFCHGRAASKLRRNGNAVIRPRAKPRRREPARHLTTKAQSHEGAEEALQGAGVTCDFATRDE